MIDQFATQIEALKRQARQAIRYRTVSAEVRKAEATLYHLRWRARTPRSPRPSTSRTSACARWLIPPAPKPKPARAEARPRWRCPSCARPRREPPRPCTGWFARRAGCRGNPRPGTHCRARPPARAIRSRHRARADARRRRRGGAGAPGGGRGNPQFRCTGPARRCGVDARVAAADAVLGAAEHTFGEFTRALADLTARRNQFDNAAREQGERIAACRRDRGDRARTPSRCRGCADRRGRGAQSAHDRSRSRGRRRRGRAHATRAASKPRAGRSPTRTRVQRLETEAKTLAKMLALETRNLWPPVIDNIAVEKGYEMALGAALGDDLDAPVDPSSPMRWIADRRRPGDPALPAGVEPLAPTSRRRRNLRAAWRRSAWSSALTAQRSRRRSSPASGWSPATAICGAGTALSPMPTRRPAPRGAWRSAAGSPISTANWRPRAPRSTRSAARSTAAQAAFEAAGRTESETPRRASATSPASAARLSALTEAGRAWSPSRDEARPPRRRRARACRTAARRRSRSKLADVRADIDGKRAKLAEVRAEQQAIAREAELADRRLTQLATDKAGWGERRTARASQIATLERRIAEAERDRTELKMRRRYSPRSAAR